MKLALGGFFAGRTADVPPLGPIARDYNKAHAVRLVQKAVLSALGVGVLGRVAAALPSFLTRKKTLPFTRVEAGIGPATAKLPTKKDDEDKDKNEKEKHAHDYQKTAGAGDSPLQRGLISPFTQLQEWLQTDPNDPQWIKGDYASTPLGVPLTTFGILAGAPAALYLGWKGTDWLIDFLKGRTQARRLQKRQKEYDKLLKDTLSKRQKTNKYSADELFDKLADGSETPSLGQRMLGAIGSTAPGALDLSGAGAGFYAALATALALSSGIWSYRFFRDRSARALAAKAISKHRKNTYPLTLQAGTDADDDE